MLREHANMTVKFKTELNLAVSSRLKLSFPQKWIWAPVVTSRKHEPLLRLGIETKAKIRAGNVIVIGEAKQQKFNPGNWKGRSVSENPCMCGCWTALMPSAELFWKGNWTVGGDPLVRMYFFKPINLKTLPDVMLPETATEANLAVNAQGKMQFSVMHLLPWWLKAHTAEKHEDMNLAGISVPPRLYYMITAQELWVRIE